MIRSEGQQWITDFRKKWVTLYFFRVLTFSLAIALILVSLLTYLTLGSFWTVVPIFLVVFTICSFTYPFWRINNEDISRYLNANFTDLQESSGLLLKPEDELSGLERMQRNKVNELLAEIKIPVTPFKKLGTALAALLLAIVLSLVIGNLHKKNNDNKMYPSVAAGQPVVHERILPQISRIAIYIDPPAYTRVQSRTQSQFSVKAEAGSSVIWNLSTNTTIKKINLIFNDREIVPLKSQNEAHTKWKSARLIKESGFYQVELDGIRSDLYQIEVIPDLPVNIKITSPKQYSTIDYGMPQRVNLQLSLTDDYGIKDAFIAATMASGKGEGVSFTEKKISFNIGFNNSRQSKLSKVIDLKLLGMKPGDELYFYINAQDNHGQTSRSDIYFVSIVDTTELMSMAGMSTGINLVPEYFRSQRQIIIDTEKLLKEKTSMAVQSFKDKSNDIGVDQKLLRLRYGKFLGEESETEIGADHDHEEAGKGHKDEEAGHKEEGHDHKEEKTEQIANVQEIMDRYAHKHDIAEDATFFEPELKAQLKAVLTEMWSSELRLRTYKPEDALPFEYKALRLLKDLQQKSRAYVAKTTVKTAQLKPEKRLSGELDKINNPTQTSTVEQKQNREYYLKKALSVLEIRKAGNKFSAADQLLLKDAEKYMAAAAAGNPASFLTALKGLRKVTAAKQPDVPEITLVQRSIQKLMIRESDQPKPQSAAPASELYQSYFNNLKKSER
ncbi:hypothetical protein [Pedobacter metabolipauper]|uniref:DUF4175 family protein n=1 Tax=Pedobacter metabolipauper TaxID=425513 RepID=A0A4R6SSM0_9SPHI|nr:hypothetical protein [Pedobacter metabolipauper]TDQ08385.1 hypothetical protein ATK78_2897 [Pedobacter metabolipauper]